MNLLSLTEIKNLLEINNTRPSKSLGQNFLIDQRVLEKIISSADIKPTDVILEVGPGLGILTYALAKKAKRVVTIEKDETMVKILSETIKNLKNVDVFNEDILKLYPTSDKYALGSEYKIVANIPYYLTSPLIRKFLECDLQPKEIILMIQKEVAQRICSKTPDMNLLAVSVQFYADAKIISTVSKNCFWPAPKVDSAIIKITPKEKYNISPDLFFKVVKAGFSHPRKQLVNNLTSLKYLNGVKLTKDKISDLLTKIGVTPNQRAETMSIENWVALSKNFKAL